ncbi:hypothetical protein [Chryseolinea lacunae]|uniref:Uncharacterized protein n=1 Tax=Chryseolinea lacunae TaxID=2801331 RepID=A0ABS1KRV6_9BACT|nr:hypothetical protein [Chryseolinea lacunae]MBL0742099.1 hypothetical protein [Chryseolinea lacunae]
MTQDEKLKRDLRSYCAFLIKEYGIIYPPTDPVIPALFAIHKDMQLNNQKNADIAFRIHEAAAKVEPRVFQLNSFKAAFGFQLGIAAKWTLWGGMLLGFAWLATWVWSINADLKKAKMIIESSKKTVELIQKVRIDNAGYYYIDFVAAKRGTIKNFHEFTKVDKNTVRVYLGKDSISTRY